MQSLAITEGFKLPFGMALTARMQRMTTTSWMSGTDTAQTAIDGDQLSFPDLTLRATYHPRALQEYITSFTASVRYVLTQQRSAAPAVSTLLPADVRTSRVQSYPVGASIVWNDVGNLTTGFSIGPTFRVDSLPGSTTDSRAQDLSVDASRSFKLPAEWQARSALRMRLGFQQTTAISDVSNGVTGGPASRIADNGRRAITLNADTDIAQNLTFSLQSAQIVTFDNTLNRKLTQVVLSAVLQLKYFCGSDEMIGLRLTRIAVLLVATACSAKGDKPAAAAVAVRTSNEFNADSAMSYIRQQLAFGPRVPGTEAARKTGDWIVSRLRTTADTVLEQKWTHTLADGKTLPMRNIFARFKPNARQRVLYVTHWDTRPFADEESDPVKAKLPMPGANDGASGVALLMAVADALKKTPPNVGVDLLFVDGEDWGTFTPRTWTC